MKKVGFIGLGIMGLPMALNILKKSGAAVMGFDVAKDRTALLAEAGGIQAGDENDVYSACDVILFSLPKNEILKAALEKAINISKAGTILIDVGSTSPDTIKEMYQKARAKSIYLFDAPVTGGEVAAQFGTLAVMVGGDKNVFPKVKDALQHVAASVTYLGESGFGSSAKLANNIIIGCYMAAFAEAFAFASKAGIDPEILYNAIKGGVVGGLAFEYLIPKMYNRDFKPGATIEVLQKDFCNAINFASSLNITLPLTQLVLGIQNEMIASERAHLDVISIVQIYEEKMGTIVERHSKKSV